MNLLYHIGCDTELLIRATPEWLVSLREQFLCLHRPSEAPIDVVIEDRPENTPLGFVASAGVAIIRKDLLMALGPDANEHLMFGKVYDSSMRLLGDLQSIGSAKKVYLRGGPRSTRAFCPQCGSFLYYPLGSWYVLESDLDGRSIYHSRSLIGLVVNEEIRDRLALQHWKKLSMNRLKIRKEPRDGLPLDLATVSPSVLVSQQPKQEL